VSFIEIGTFHILTSCCCGFELLNTGHLCHCGACVMMLHGYAFGIPHKANNFISGKMHTFLFLVK
jgi:hypothetical protein